MILWVCRPIVWIILGASYFFKRSFWKGAFFSRRNFSGLPVLDVFVDVQICGERSKYVTWCFSLRWGSVIRIWLDIPLHGYFASCGYHLPHLFSRSRIIVFLSNRSFMLGGASWFNGTTLLSNGGGGGGIVVNRPLMLTFCCIAPLWIWVELFLPSRRWTFECRIEWWCERSSGRSTISE